MAVCGYIKPDGERCKALPMKGEGYCYAHHPDLEDKRRAASSKGGKRGGRGRARPGGGDIKDVKAPQARLRCRGGAFGGKGRLRRLADPQRVPPGRGGRDIKDVKAWLLKLASDVEEGRLEAKDGSVVSQILNVFLRGVEVERKIKESEELEERLEALEGVLKGRKAG
jgi:hypothetical protein